MISERGQEVPLESDCDSSLTETSLPLRAEGDKTVMLAVPAQSPALQSKATVMNRRPSECRRPDVPSAFAASFRAAGDGFLNALCIHSKTKEHREFVQTSEHARDTCKRVRSLAERYTRTISKQSCLCPLVPLLWASLGLAAERGACQSLWTEVAIS